MLFRRLFVAALVLAGVGIAIPTVFAQQSAPPLVKPLARPTRQLDTTPGYDPTAVLVRFKPTASAAAIATSLSKRGATPLRSVANGGFVKVRTSGDAPALLAALRKDPAVQSATLDFRRQLSAVPNDPLYAANQPYLGTVRLPQAWDLVKDASSQVIAVIDTGVDTTHPDLVGRTVAGYNVVAPGTDPIDTLGHGTMVAGIAAANTANGVGVAGAAWNGRVMPVKVFQDTGGAFDSDVATGIIWATDHGAKVLNLSLGGPGDSVVLHDAVRYATDHGALVVVAAGNSGDNTPQYPAAYPEALAVSATDSAATITDFSSSGDWVDLAAPGFGIVSTHPAALGFSYGIGDGTSFSAPIVAGVAALVRAKFPTLTPAQVADRLRSTARDAGPRGIDPYYGYGVLDAYNAVGGSWGAEFPMNALGLGEPNDVPARATAVASSVTGSIEAEGDVDWYRYDVAALVSVTATVTPAPFAPAYAQNMDPILEVYDAHLKLLGRADLGVAGDAEQLSVVLAAGTNYVAVRNFNGAADIRPYGLVVAASPPTIFQPTQWTPVGVSTWPLTVAVGDVTGDGRYDVVLATTAYTDPVNDYKLFVFAQQPDGSLATAVKYTPTQPSISASFALLDADGDGRLDVALAGPSGVEILHQNVSGALENSGLLAGITGDTTQVTAADMDGDGDSDLVVSQSTGIAVLTHESDGTFTSVPVSADKGSELATGDVDGDGRIDIATYLYGNTDVRVYHHGVAGWTRTLHNAIAAGAPSIVWGIDVADVNNDGRADVMATTGGNRPAAVLNVFLQNAGGTLDAPAFYPTVDIPEPVEAADIDGDGRTDVVIAHGGYRTLSVLLQRADATLDTPTTTLISSASHFDSHGLAVGDINGDTFPDVVVADQLFGLVIVRQTAAGHSTVGGARSFVHDVAPADFASSVPLNTVPRVGFSTDLDPTSVTTDTVRLVHGRTGATVPTTPTYDSATKTVTLTPAVPLQDNTPYRIVVAGVRDLASVTQLDPFTSTFRTLNVAPTLSSFTATGGAGAVTLSWTMPAITDLDQVIVRMAVGTTTPPATPTSGTAAYSGSGSSVRITGLTGGTRYAFSAWVKDRTGLFSAVRTARLTGTADIININTTVSTYGGSVTVTGRVTRTDTGAGLSKVPVALYGRRKGTTTWTLLGTATSSTTGYLTLVNKPQWSLDYRWQYNGSTTYMGSVSSVRTEGVHTSISATLSPAPIRLGQSATLSGTVGPNHAGKIVYLQRLVNGVWVTGSARTLSATSTYSYSIKPTSRGTYTYRIYLPADTDHLYGVSAARALKVT